MAVWGMAKSVTAQSASYPVDCKEPLLLNPEQVPLLFPKADSGDVQAQCLLGFAYHHGFSVAKNDTEAAKWLSKAA